GGNTFRGFNSGLPAIVISAASFTGPVSAQKNLFSVADPETVIFDQNDDASKANVVATNSLAGNAAYVQALYLELLHRAGDTNNANDAGMWVTQLNNGTPAASV